MEHTNAYLLERIDCNCNNCGLMQRDLGEWQKWHDWHRAIELTVFEKAKTKAIAEAQRIPDEKMRKGMLYHANKMRFMFDKSKLISYGFCTHFQKKVSFIPNTCQPDTQLCFIHRKDYTRV